MLAKFTGVEIPTDNPFANDKLERINIAENLTKLIQSTNQPFVISVEGPWGSGKTTFINMWKMKLESLGHTCLYFNAWENDFVEDPLIAFIGEISKAIEQKKITGNAGKRIKKLKNIGGKLVRRVIPLTIQIATQNLVNQETVKKTFAILSENADKVSGLASEMAEERIKQYEADKTGIIEFKTELAGFAKSLAEDKARTTPLIFFIDELDRCRPDFSISLLERIKHLFSVEGIVFILAIDRGQIEQSVKSIYGSEMNTDGYLRRFIDFGLRLPTPSIGSYCQSMFEYFHLEEVFQNRRNPKEMSDIFMRVFIQFANLYKFTPRIIAQCFTEMNVILRTTPKNLEVCGELIAFVISMKVFHPEIFTLLKGEMNNQDIQKIMAVIKSEILDEESDIKWFAPELELILLRSYLKEDNFAVTIGMARKNAVNENHADQKYLSDMVGLLQTPYYRDSARALKSIFSRIELAESLI